MNFKSAKELLEICTKEGILISEVMIQREVTEGEKQREEVINRMHTAFNIMKESANRAINNPAQSMGGLLGGQAKKLSDHVGSGKTACGSLVTRGIAYAMGVLEVNAQMGLIVAAPTAGSSGVIPGTMLTLQDEYGFTDDQIVTALFNTGAIGYLAMKNATVSGAVGGCQAEIGIASAMAASAAVELLGGTPAQSLDAASTVMMNMLGLVCDPVAGLVEYPCQNRNASGVANALVATEMAMSGITQLIPFDEMLEILYKVGRDMPVELRETALGGCALSESACNACKACK
ncbi:MAG: L-serine ammonia-lyase, iron-sulfur-dependent, subunit alpha [Bacillota bacterium]|nr:L-serine ammonia-lyase, iron-sulfur-dependent, subunit alpha [Bacillota bacterium]